MHNEPVLNIELSERLSGIGEYYFSKKLREIDSMRAAGKDIINLGVGSPDRPPHPSVTAKLSEAAAKPGAHAYQPYKGSAALRSAFSEWYGKYYGVGLDPDTEILPLIGSKEGLMHICMTYLGKGDKVLIPDPGYPTYRSAVTLAGGECVEYRLTEQGGWMPDFEQIEWLGPENVKIMIINYPHMPTGAVPTRELFKTLVKFAKRHNILLVHDNPYSFIRNSEPLSLLSVPGAISVAVELNSMSKSHNMAGWRIGMVAGAKERIDEILRFKSNMDSGTFLPMQEAAVVALGLGDEWYRELNGVYYSRESKAYEILSELGCTFSPGQAGLFVWASIPENFEGDCFAFSDKVLYEKGVFITPGGIFGNEGKKHIRISLCSDENTLQKALDKIRS